jgi:hypothetical protein
LAVMLVVLERPSLDSLLVVDNLVVSKDSTPQLMMVLAPVLVAALPVVLVTVLVRVLVTLLVIMVLLLLLVAVEAAPREMILFVAAMSVLVLMPAMCTEALPLLAVLVQVSMPWLVL